MSMKAEIEQVEQIIGDKTKIQIDAEALFSGPSR